MKWYAVQYGDNFDWDNGSNDYNEAIDMAKAIMNDSEYDGLEIRIAVINDETKFCENELIIREGARG